MSTTLDGQSLFDGQDVEIEKGSFSRDSVERAVPGLDGVLSIDLGGRGRKIKQTGVLWARSRSHVTEKISAISACMDGDTHTLVTKSGEEFGNLRMDLFKVTEERASGGGVAVDYEIVYTQLVIQ
jgi:hypothetical protein